MGRILGALLAALLTVPAVTMPPVAEADVSEVAVSDFTPTLSVWRPCRGLAGLVCADLTVPLDYDDPGGRTITVAVSQRPASRAPYKGVMIVNPGGPGASGLEWADLADDVPGGVGRQYTWIGFDPRGVGASRPALQCDATYFAPPRPDYVPRTKRLMKTWRDRADRYAAACGRSVNSFLLPYLGTRDTVRDVESLRIALGVSKINFYGFSYGSYLGQAYATSYPGRVGRMVLDGIVDPTTYWYGANLGQERGFDRTINQFFQWVAKRNGRYRLGRKWRAVRKAYERQLRALAQRPAARGTFGSAELNDVLLDAGYGVYRWPELARGLSELVRRHKAGQLASIYRFTTSGGDSDYAGYLAVQCSDRRAPTWDVQVRDAWSMYRRHPFLAWNNTWFNAPCTAWPAPVRGTPTISGSGLNAAGTRILLISETLDAATPYSGALRVRRMFPTASLIAGVGGTTHASSLSGVGCVDNAVARYLRDGAVPPRRAGDGADLSCPRLTPARLGASGFRVAPVS